MDNKKELWEESFQRKDNFVFYPHEEIIRFFAKYISQRKGLNTFKKIYISTETPKVLDLGCGIGRHVIFSHTMQTDAYGIDLSDAAIEFARDWAAKEGIEHADKKIIQGDITKMPFENNFFDFIISHGVLDSMHLETSVKSFQEAARVLKPEGYFYCDLISGDDSAHHPDFHGEEIVNTEHEKGTIQLYFNQALLEKVISPYFTIHETVFIKRENITNKQFYSRYHLVLRKK